MVKISFKADVDSFRELKKLNDREVNKAAARALNRAIDAAATIAGREVSAATKIKVREVRSRMFVTGSTPGRLVAQLGVLGYAPNLGKFRPAQNKVGVAASAWEGRKTYQHAFLIKRTGEVVARISGSRKKLKALYGPSVPRTFDRRAIIEKVSEAARVRFTSELEREITRRLGQR